MNRAEPIRRVDSFKADRRLSDELVQRGFGLEKRTSSLTPRGAPRVVFTQPPSGEDVEWSSTQLAQDMSGRPPPGPSSSSSSSTMTMTTTSATMMTMMMMTAPGLVVGDDPHHTNTVSLSQEAPVGSQAVVRQMSRVRCETGSLARRPFFTVDEEMVGSSSPTASRSVTSSPATVSRKSKFESLRGKIVAQHVQWSPLVRGGTGPTSTEPLPSPPTDTTSSTPAALPPELSKGNQTDDEDHDHEPTQSSSSSLSFRRLSKSIARSKPRPEPSSSSSLHVLPRSASAHSDKHPVTVKTKPSVLAAFPKPKFSKPALSVDVHADRDDPIINTTGSIPSSNSKVDTDRKDLSWNTTASRIPTGKADHRRSLSFAVGVAASLLSPTAKHTPGIPNNNFGDDNNNNNSAEGAPNVIRDSEPSDFDKRVVSLPNFDPSSQGLNVVDDQHFTTTVDDGHTSSSASKNPISLGAEEQHTDSPRRLRSKCKTREASSIKELARRLFTDTLDSPRSKSKLRGDVDSLDELARQFGVSVIHLTGDDAYDDDNNNNNYYNYELSSSSPRRRIDSGSGFRSRSKPRSRNRSQSRPRAGDVEGEEGEGEEDAASPAASGSIKNSLRRWGSQDGSAESPRRRIRSNSNRKPSVLSLPSRITRKSTTTTPRADGDDSYAEIDGNMSSATLTNIPQHNNTVHTSFFDSQHESDCAEANSVYKMNPDGSRENCSSQGFQQM